MKNFLIALLYLIGSNICHADTDSQVKEKIIMGWVEHVRLIPLDALVRAKLDTGANTSSLHAENVTYFKKGGEPWVRFEFKTPHKRKKGQKPTAEDDRVLHVIERPVVRTTLIKRHQQSSMQRTVISLPISIGGKTFESEFTLTNRGNFIYPVLLGRRFLKDIALIDPSQTYLFSDRVPVKNKKVTENALQEPKVENNKNE